MGVLEGWQLCSDLQGSLTVTKKNKKVENKSCYVH